MKNLVIMIKADSQAFNFPISMCLVFLKKRIIAYLEKVLTTEFTAKFIAGAFNHSIFFEIENMNLNQLVLEMEPEHEIRENYVSLVDSRKELF